MTKLINGLISVIKILIKSNWGLMFKDFKELSKKDILILGNGPSLNSQWEEIEKARTKLELMVVNKFALSPRFEQLKPEHYVFLDSAFFNFNESVYLDATLHPMVKLKPNWAELQQQINDAWTRILKSDWSLIVWIPYIYRKSFIIDYLKKNKVKFQFYNYVVLKGSGMDFLFAQKLGMPQSQNVINSAIALSIWLNPKNLYLSGLDHTFHLGIEIDEENFLWDAGSHFYAQGEPQTRQKLININTHKKVTLKELFLSLSKVHIAYEKLARLAAQNHTEIWNITQGGFVDAFQRKNIKYINKK